MSTGEDSSLGGAGNEHRTPDDDRGTCTPCRGTGKVTSSLAGKEHEVMCPWCGGSGRFQPGRDAQESPAELDPRDAQ